MPFTMVAPSPFAAFQAQDGSRYAADNNGLASGVTIDDVLSMLSDGCVPLGIPGSDGAALAVLLADYALANSTAAQAAFNSSTAGALTLPAGLFTFDAELFLTNTGTTSHFWNVLFGGTATLASIAYSIVGNSTTAAGAAASGYSGYANAATAFQATPASTSATEFAAVKLRGILNVSAAGTVIPQVQLSAAPGGAQKAKAGSFFRALQLPASGLIGSWS